MVDQDSAADGEETPHQKINKNAENRKNIANEPRKRSQVESKRSNIANVRASQNSKISKKELKTSQQNSASIQKISTPASIERHNYDIDNEYADDGFDEDNHNDDEPVPTKTSDKKRPTPSNSKLSKSKNSNVHRSVENNDYSSHDTSPNKYQVNSKLAHNKALKKTTSKENLNL